jgi:hypothetical protein
LEKRNAALIARLTESRLDFVAADFPQANRFTIHILAAGLQAHGQDCSEALMAFNALLAGHTGLAPMFIALMSCPTTGPAAARRAARTAADIRSRKECRRPLPLPFLRDRSQYRPSIVNVGLANSRLHQWQIFVAGSGSLTGGFIRPIH